MNMKRTRRYGGFRIGDRVKHKKFGKGVVEGYFNGCIFVWFDKFVTNGDYFGSTIAPNQLINLTRIEENKITDPLPLMREETAKKLAELLLKSNEDLINKRAEESINLMAKDANDVVSAIFAPDPLPSPYTRDVYTSSKDFD